MMQTKWSRALPASVDRQLSLAARGKHHTCERAHSNTWPPKLLCGISAAAVLLAVRQGAAGRAAVLTLWLCVNAPIGVNVKLSRPARAAAAETARVEGALDGRILCVR